MIKDCRKFVSHDIKLDFHDVLIVPRKSRVTSRSKVSIERKFHFRNGKTQIWTGVPIVSSNMDTVTSLESFKVLQKHNYLSCFPKYMNKQFLDKIPDELSYTKHYMLSCGIGDNDVNTVIQLIDQLAKCDIHVKFLCIDIANGYLTPLLDVCRELRLRYPNIILVAGNVVTPDITQELIVDGGVNIVKLGCGSGGACVTRLKAGVGYPQLSTILECAQVAHDVKGYIMSDGGIVHPCDVNKAYAAGADFVMIGSVFAGHDESPGEMIFDTADNTRKKVFYGMASEDAVQKYNGGLQSYRSSEGKKVLMKCKGPLDNTILDINGSIRSACSYTNSKNIEELATNANFVLVNTSHNTSLS